MSTLTDYNVSFEMKKINNFYIKFMHSSNFYLESIIADFVSITSCDNLLEAIGRRSNISQNGDIIYPTQSLQLITISYTTTKIYHDSVAYDSNPNITPDYSLPTADFKEIVKAWRNFVKDETLT